MIILQLIDSLGNGGAEKFSVELSNELSHNHLVILCSVLPVEDWMQPPISLSSRVQLLSLNLKRPFSLKGFFAFLKLIRIIRPDVVHIHASILVFILFPLSFCFIKIIFLQTVHNTLTPGYKKLLDLISRMWFMNKHFINVCIADFIHKEMAQRYPNLYFEKIDNGIFPMRPGPNAERVRREVDNYKYSSETRVFIAIGNYSNFKNFVSLAEVVNSLSQEGWDIILLIIGNGQNPVSIGNYEKVRAVKGNDIHQLGYKTNISDYLSNSDALVISSTQEGMPLVALEAMSLGLPIVTTPAGGMVNIVQDGENGFMAQGFSKNQIADALVRFIKADDDVLHKIRCNNQLKFEQQYSMAYCAEKYERLYQRSAVRVSNEL